jgi:hypothetical protein
MRWAFRESLLFLFFLHVFLVLRFPSRRPRWQAAASVLGAALFILPLPFARVPTLNPLALDREFLFSGKAQAYWERVKLELKPGDEIVTAIDWSYWQTNHTGMPYTLLGTANFPEYFRVRCASGYAPTAPVDQMPLKTVPGYWFGAYHADQLPAVLAERPGLRVLQIVSTQPLKITLSADAGAVIDLTPQMEAAGINPADSDSSAEY